MRLCRCFHPESCSGGTIFLTAVPLGGHMFGRVISLRFLSVALGLFLGLLSRLVGPRHPPIGQQLPSEGGATDIYSNIHDGQDGATVCLCFSAGPTISHLEWTLTSCLARDIKHQLAARSAAGIAQSCPLTNERVPMCRPSRADEAIDGCHNGDVTGPCWPGAWEASHRSGSALFIGAIGRR